MNRIVALAPFLLAACQTTGAPAAFRYRCADGAVLAVSYPDSDRAIVTYRGDAIEMRRAISASGARYVGAGWQWWSKGMTQGWIAPVAPGETIASAHGITCEAR